MCRSNTVLFLLLREQFLTCVKKSLLEWANCDSLTLAPIEVPESKSCLANILATPPHLEKHKL